MPNFIYRFQAENNVHFNQTIPQNKKKPDRVYLFLYLFEIGDLVEADLVVLQRFAPFLVSQVDHVQPNARRQGYVSSGLSFVQNGRHYYLVDAI